MRQILLLLIAVWICSCNVFTPRSSEEPENFGEWEPFPVNYNQVVENLKMAILYPQNSTKYADILSDDFVFIFDDQDCNDLDVPQSWNRLREIAYLVNFHNQWKNDINIEFFEIENESDYIQTNSAVISRNYEIMINYDEKQSQIYRGKFVLTIDDYDGFWKVRRWEDSRASSEIFSWGRLKDEFDY